MDQASAARDIIGNNDTRVLDTDEENDSYDDAPDGELSRKERKSLSLTLKLQFQYLLFE